MANHIVKKTDGTKLQFPENGSGHLTVIETDGVTTNDLVLTEG